MTNANDARLASRAVSAALLVAAASWIGCGSIDEASGVSNRRRDPTNPPTSDAEPDAPPSSPPDAGTSTPPDTGVPPEPPDAGAPPIPDAGPSTPDVRAPGVDAGPPVPDAGPQVPDAGVGPDGGTRPPVGQPACGGSGPATNKVGGLASNWILTDQDGKTVALSDFCDKTVYVDFGAMWCPPCRDSAEELEEKYQKFKSRGFITLSVLFENNKSKPPTQTDLQAWKTTYGLTTPVLSDPMSTVESALWPGNDAIPRMALIKVGGIVADLSYPSDNDIERVLP